MLPSRSVLTFHSNLHLPAMSLSSWVVSNKTPVPVGVTLGNPVHLNSLGAGRHDAVVSLCRMLTSSSTINKALRTKQVLQPIIKNT